MSNLSSTRIKQHWSTGYRTFELVNLAELCERLRPSTSSIVSWNQQGQNDGELLALALFRILGFDSLCCYLEQSGSTTQQQ
jgi:hypothetical protein